ncbi:MAG: rhodanese-like domain-containing protein [Actinomycetota bacterium]|nr:rhodanese-like domain-containing protein [Actinomycetota bacterium]
MLFRQFVDDDLGCASYLVGDEAAGVAVVVDPAYAIDQYLVEADRRGVGIVRVLETHTHADHLSGHGRFALESGLPVCVHPAAEPEFPFEPLEEGAQLEVGEVVFRVLHTPGHRPEHCCFSVVDRSRGDEPWLVLTGDSLLIGDAARPDLAVEAREGAEGLFHSLRRLAELADGVEVYPGHVAGSLCGVGMSSKASSTIGFERRFNPAFLASRDLAEFISERTRVSTPPPPNMERIVALNRGPFVGSPRPREPVTSANGAAVLDVRREEEFARGHVPGAINVPVEATAFGTRAGFVLDPDVPVAIHASSADAGDRAARNLRAVGFLDLLGYLVDVEAPERLEPVGLEELERLLATGDVELLDVREKDERDDGYVPGSRHLPYRSVGAWADELGREKPVVTMCESGARASIAASVLASRGVDARPVLGTGITDWKAQGKPTVSFRRCGS